jgi:hypothetical protein
MKKIFKTLSIGLAVVFLGLSAQAVPKEQFSNAVDLLVCRIGGATLSGQKALDFGSKFKCSKTGTYSSGEIAAFMKGEDKTSQLISEIQQLMAQPFQDWDQQRSITFLTEDVFNNKDNFPKLNAFAEKRKPMGQFDQLISSMKLELSAVLPSGTDKPAPSLAPPPLEPLRSTVGGAFWDLPNFDVSFVAISLCIFLLAAGILYLFLATRKTSEVWDKEFLGFERRIRSIENVQSNSSTAAVRTSTGRSGVDAEIKSLSTQISDLRRAVTTLQNADLNPSGVSSRHSTSSDGNYKNRGLFEEHVRPIEPRVEVFYLSTPNSGGAFDVQSALPSFQEGKSIYKFSKTSPTSAEYQIDESEAAARIALQYPDRTIDPVCDGVNPFDPNAKRIVTESAGTASLVGDQWVIKTRARIRYEY